ncbi:hypothetical protein VAE151_560166 [Vibrio aestuarianus]|nr:hypothetical protein VAE032_270810 [Vibrio aestuarianus]CAH8202543.1 hypothetical protein VAE115_320810 [Vibrio aestuarianus]CAH8212376.1 hypothetical protein VAE016_370811 [Vibrio aestuarianus]CAH8213817.1 hypothetical protein VAE151_560166 [Vibrio aestuarianus]CAH8217282.1 hypothetical protein VAEU17_3720002 [Vibrio aestuarianus]
MMAVTANAVRGLVAHISYSPTHDRKKDSTNKAFLLILSLGFWLGFYPFSSVDIRY